jgi:uncharacterized protein YndB with AHSA1/START domain
MSTMTAQTTQVYELYIKASPEQVWDAITKPEFTAKYFYGTRVESTFEAGAPIAYLGDDEGVMVDGEIVESDPPRRLVQSWHPLFDDGMSSEPPSRVTWELEAQESGATRLTVVHDRLESAPKTAESVSGGWMYILSGLKTLLETGSPLAG